MAGQRDKNIYIGIDAGSTTVKMAAIDERGAVLDGVYLRSSGDSIKAILDAANGLRVRLGGGHSVLGSGSTGS
ncbi:MAG: 2-hydroxyglutaryl-CoA dehydratase, partial [Candidatus Coatesbacteria bacterium]|nr:2-hydroxyglutaryl-CoA dehydratase [Candidatus Coatesbacteria bacterium]